MTRFSVVVIGLLCGLVMPVWAGDHIEEVSSAGIQTAFATAEVVLTNSRSYLIVAGGGTQSGEIREDVDAWEIGKNSWDTVNISGDSYRQAVWGTSAKIEDTMYLFGGQDDLGLIPLDSYQTIRFFAGQGDEINGEVETWSASGDIPAPRDLAEAAYFPGTGFIYLFGGRTADGLSDKAWCFNPITGEFFPLPPIPFTLSQFGLSIWDRGFVLFGGLTDGTGGSIVVSEEVLTFDVHTWTWTAEDHGGDAIEPAYFLEATALSNNKLWFGGGLFADGSPSNMTYIYDVQNSHVSSADPLLTGIVGFGVGTVPRDATTGLDVQVVGHGGDIGGGLSNTTWVYTSPVRVIPDHVAAATGTGRGSNTDFFTEAWVANVGTDSSDVMGMFTSRDGAIVLESSTTLPPETMFHTSHFMRDFFDVLVEMFGGTSFWTASGDRVFVFGQVRITGEDPSGKQYGQSFELLNIGIEYDLSFGSKDATGPQREITSDHRAESSTRSGTPFKRATRTLETAYLFTTEDIVSNRVNVGGMAVEAAALIITPELPLGNPLAPSRRIELDAGRSFQINNVYNSFNLSSGDANAIISIAVESGSLVSYGSVLDGNGAYEGTSDPTTIRPVARPGSNETLLLEIGSITGQGGTQFKGSASILNFDEETAMVRADFFRRGSPGVSTSATLSVPGGGVLGFSDFASEVLGVEGDVGTVRFTTNGGGIAVTGREYSVEVDEGGNVIGTAGQLMRGLTEEDLLEPEFNCHGLGVRQGDGERSHIAFFNPGTASATIEVSLFDGDGAFEGNQSFIVPGQTLEQFNNIIRLIDPSHDGNEKRIEVTVTQPIYGALFRVNPWDDPVTFDFHCRQ